MDPSGHLRPHRISVFSSLDLIDWRYVNDALSEGPSWIDPGAGIPGGLSATARPAMLDALDWIDGWPVARGGYGPSDSTSPQPIPAAQPGGRNTYIQRVRADDQPGDLLSAYSDDFNAATLSTQWTFLHLTPPVWRLTGSAYQVTTVAADPRLRW